MPNPVITTNYAGITQPEILQLLILGNEAFSKKSFMFHEDVDDKGMELSRLTIAADIIQSYAAMPANPSNAISFTPRRIDPVECMIFDLLNPKEFRSYWRQYQTDMKLAEKIVQPEVQAAILANYAKRVDGQLGKLVWQGDKTTSGVLRFINGIITVAAADANVVKPTPAGALTSANILAQLQAVDLLIPDALYDEPTCVYHMSTKNFRDYQSAVLALPNKGQGPAEKVPALYKNREIRYYSAFPQNYILVCKADNSPQSALHAGMNSSTDNDNIKMERYRPEGDTYFLKANFSLDVNYAFSEELVLYKPS